MLVWNQKWRTVREVLQVEHILGLIIGRLLRQETLDHPWFYWSQRMVIKQHWTKPDRITKSGSNSILMQRFLTGYGFGIVVSDADGNILEAKTGSFGEVVRPELVEHIALKEALNYINELMWRQVKLELDCSNLS